MRRSLGPAELLHLRIVKDTRFVVFQTEAKKLIHRQLRERIADFVLVHNEDIIVILEAKRSEHSPAIAGDDIGTDVARMLEGAELPIESGVIRELEERLHLDTTRSPATCPHRSP